MNVEERTARVREAMEAAYNAYFEDVYKFVLRGVGNKTAAEDITHDVFCTALNKAEEFMSHPEPKGWLMVTAKNKLRELYRRMKPSARESLEGVLEPSAEAPGYGGTELELTALAIINEEEWALVKDYYLVGITIRELAEKYGITENNMRVRLHRIRGRMRRGMGG